MAVSVESRKDGSEDGRGKRGMSHEQQALLRREYAESVRKNLKAQLDSLRIERPDKTVEKLKRVSSNESR